MSRKEYGSLELENASTLKFWDAVNSGSILIKPPSSLGGAFTLTLPAVNDTLAGIVATQTLTNKTIDGASNTLTIRAASDITGQLPTSKGGTGQNSTATFPTSGTVSTTTLTESPTNKTFDSTSTMTGVKIASFTPDGTHTLTFPTITDTIVSITSTNTAGSRLQNKDLDAGSTRIVDPSDTSKRLVMSLGSMTTATILTLTGQQSTSQNLNFPNITSSDTITTNSFAAVLSNKTIADALTLTEISTPSNPASSYVKLYSKSGDGLYILAPNGVEKQIDIGVGQKNYLQAYTSTSDYWSAVPGSGATTNATITITTDTTSNSPRPNTTKTSIKMVATAASGGTPVSADAWAEFLLDPADYGVKLQLQFAMNTGGGYVANDYQVVVVCSASPIITPTINSGTRLALSTDLAGVSGLPKLAGTYRTTFDAPGASTPYIVVMFVPTVTATSTLYVSDLIVGPGVVTQGAALTQWVNSGAISFSTGAAGTTSVNNLYYRRTGDSLDLRAEFIQTGAGTQGSGVYGITLPNGYQIDTTKLDSNFDGLATGMGPALFYDGTLVWSGVVQALDATHVYFAIGNSANATASWQSGSSRHLGSTSLRFSFFATVPISQFAGSGTVNVVQNDLQYYYSAGNTWGTTNTSATTSQGQGGVTYTMGTPSGTAFHYDFTPTTPTPVGAMVQLQLSIDGTHWGPPGVILPGLTGSIDTFHYDGTQYVGAGASLDSTGKIIVYFGKYATGGSTAWNGTWYWRVAVGLPGQAVGFGQVTQTGSGLVASAGQLLGTNTNDAASAGNVGQLLTGSTARTAPVSLSSGVDKTVATITLTAGDWQVSGGLGLKPAATTVIQNIIFGISSTNNSVQSVNNWGVPQSTGDLTFSYGYTATLNEDQAGIIPAYQVTVANGNTLPLYLVTETAFTTSTCAAYGYIQARRMR